MLNDASSKASAGECADAGSAATTADPALASPQPWFEIYLQRITAARRYLDRMHLHVSRVSSEVLVPAWRVSGYTGRFSNEDLIELAASHGFEEARDAAS